MITKIISGGQSGADRGGFMAALGARIPIGGWAPKGWFAEDGQIPQEYRPFMKETSSYEYPERTRFNVRDSDATILFYGAKGMGVGSRLTADLCHSMNRQILVLQLAETDKGLDAQIDRIVDWVGNIERIGKTDGTILNVAGSRESRAKGIQSLVAVVMTSVLGRLMANQKAP